MKQIGSEDARRRFRDLLDDAQAGESAEITRNGKSVAVLMPAARHADAMGVWRGVRAVTSGSDGKPLPNDATLTVGDLHSAIGEATLAELKAQTPEES